MSAATNTSISEMALLVRERDNFVICGHVSPDGDCLGSQLALAEALRALGKTVTCVLAQDDLIGSGFGFLPGIESLVPASRFEGPADTFFAVDVSVKDRLGDAAPLFERCSASFALDHHASCAPLCDFQYVDPDSPSASLLVWALAKELLAAPSADCALCAYTGLVTDTGGFRFQNSTEEAFKAASELVLFGADPAFVATQVFQNRSLPSLELERIALERMRVFCEGRGVLSWITLDDLQTLGAQKSDTEPLIDAIRSLEGTRVACMLRQQEDSIRGSLRAKDATDVSALARTLNGGGHVAAAGFTLYMTMDEAVPFMEMKISELLQG